MFNVDTITLGMNFEDKTQSEIGQLLDISQVQVSRIEKKVLHKLKSYITM